MTVEKPKLKQLLLPITTGAASEMNQSQFLAITYNSLKAREKSRVHGAIGFGFTSHWLKNWHESFKPITKRSDCNTLLLSTVIWKLLYYIYHRFQHINEANESFCIDPLDSCVCSFKQKELWLQARLQ